MMFAGVAPESILRSFGKIHVGKPLAPKSRRELTASLRHQGCSMGTLHVNRTGQTAGGCLVDFRNENGALMEG